MTKTSKKIVEEKTTVEQRYVVWQKLLTRPEGVSYEEMIIALEEKYETFIDYDTLRQDKKAILSLLKSHGISFTEHKKKKSKRFHVEENGLDLVAMSKEQKMAQPYVAILDMLSKSKGLLPEEFLVSLCDKYRQLSENVNVSKSISFEADYNSMATLDLFPDIYKSLNKSALWVSFHPVNKPEEYVEGQFYPEYLKQFRSNWYAYGMFQEEGKLAVFQRIPLSNIDRFNDEEAEDYPFKKSHIEDYEEYLGNIIGVENSEATKVETVKFRISERMYQRLLNKRLHHSQTRCEELDTKDFKGMMINVKYNIELMRTILNLGADIEIVEPAHIRKRVIKNLQKALKLYDK